MQALETQAHAQPYLLVMQNLEGNIPLDVSVIQGKKDKAICLIQYMKFIKQSSAIWFITKPNKLDFKFEKAMTLAIQKGMNSDFLRKFPKGSVKTVLVSLQ